VYKQCNIAAWTSLCTPGTLPVPTGAIANWRRCKCPKWLYYTSTWKRVSAKTNSWERAETLAKRLSNELAAALAAPVEAVVSDPSPTEPVMTLDQAIDLYLEDKKEQQAGDALTGKLTRLLKIRLVKFCASEPAPPITGVLLPVGMRPTSLFRTG